MKWTAHFTGRTLGAIGIMQRFRLDLEAQEYRAAHDEFWRKVYDTHQDITQLALMPREKK